MLFGRWRWLLWIACIFAVAGCRTVQGSSVATGQVQAPVRDDAPVRLSVLIAPASDQVGIVQSRGVGKLEDLVEEFEAQVRKVGGNYGKIDSMRTKFEMVTTIQSYTYNCGSTKAPVTCTGSRPVTTEVATTQILGRAFHVDAP